MWEHQLLLHANHMLHPKDDIKQRKTLAQKTKKNATGDWIKFTFLALQKKQIYSQQNNIHDPFMARIERKYEVFKQTKH